MYIYYIINIILNDIKKTFLSIEYGIKVLRV